LRLSYTHCQPHHHLLPGSSVPCPRRWWKKGIYLMQKCRNCYTPLPAVRLTDCPNPDCFCLCLLKNNSYRRCLLLYHTPVRHCNARSFRYQYRYHRLMPNPIGSFGSSPLTPKGGIVVVRGVLFFYVMYFA